MFKFLGRNAARSAPAAEEIEEPRFTRFQTPEERDALRGQYTRKNPVPLKSPSAKIVQLPLREPPPEPVQQPQLDDNAHLYSSNDIPVNVLKKALPKRFSQPPKSHKKAVV